LIANAPNVALTVPDPALQSSVPLTSTSPDAIRFLAVPDVASYDSNSPDVIVRLLTVRANPFPFQY